MVSCSDFPSSLGIPSAGPAQFIIGASCLGSRVGADTRSVGCRRRCLSGVTAASDWGFVRLVR